MDMRPEFLAKEADRLTRDAVLLYAVDGLKAEALDQLSTVDPTDHVKIIQLQERYRASSEILQSLKDYLDRQMMQDATPAI